MVGGEIVLRVVNTGRVDGEIRKRQGEKRPSKVKEEADEMGGQWKRYLGVLVGQLGAAGGSWAGQDQTQLYSVPRIPTYAGLLRGSSQAGAEVHETWRLYLC